MAWNAGAAEPQPSANAAPATDIPARPDTTVSAAPGFDLRSPAVRDIVRSTAATQGGTGYRLEVSRPSRTDADIAASLREERPVVAKPAAPRLPDRPPPCDGFWSCGIETLLGLEDFDDETYARVQRDRLMNQGSFTDSRKINSGVLLPPSAGEMQSAGAPHRP